LGEGAAKRRLRWRTASTARTVWGARPRRRSEAWEEIQEQREEIRREHVEIEREREVVREEREELERERESGGPEEPGGFETEAH
jgi:hypothetical protein